jgi:NAD(P)-dependent dehydrogenase (short-subunit alcohol dehydrogenase family)
MARLAEKVAIVTGAGRGIGRAIALRCAAEGAHIVAADIEAATAQEAATAIERLDRRSLALRVDLGDMADIETLVARTLEAFGRIDILVNNAGVTKGVELFDITPEDWDWMHRINARGAFFCLQAVAREMVKQRYGKIVNMASIAGKGYRQTSNIAYAASKGAVIVMTQIAAQYLAADNINVNAICPGATLTEMLRGIQRDRSRQRGLAETALEQGWVTSIPLQRANTPEDIAALAVFLASDEARNITGQAVTIDGGLMAH